MTIRDHRNPFLMERKRQDRQRRANARKDRKTRDFKSSRARNAQELLNILSSTSD